MKKPEREPDYMTEFGAYFWFEEMVMLHPTMGKIIPIKEDADGCLVAASLWSNRPLKLSENIQEARRKWWYDVFESKFLGETNREQQ